VFNPSMRQPVHTTDIDRRTDVFSDGRTDGETDSVKT